MKNKFFKKIKKGFTMIEILFVVIGMIIATEVVINLFLFALHKSYEYIYVNNLVNVYKKLDLKNGTFLCYYNTGDNVGYKGNGIPVYKEAYFYNKNTNGIEIKLCDAIKFDIDALNDDKIPGFNGYKIKTWIIFKQRINDLIFYKIMYGLKKNENENRIVFFTYNLKGSLTDEEINDVKDYLIGFQRIKDNLNIENYGFLFNKFDINIIDNYDTLGNSDGNYEGEFIKYNQVLFIYSFGTYGKYKKLYKLYKN